MNFTFIHGFNSRATESADIPTALRSLGGEVSCVSYDTFDPFERNMDVLAEQLSDDSLIVGLSLGGFYAGKLAEKFQRKAVLINPGRNPSLALSPIVGVPMANFADGEVKTLSFTAYNSYRGQAVSSPDMNPKPLVLLDLGDMLLDARLTAFMMADSNVVMFSGGNHFFSHIREALPHIQAYAVDNPA